VTGGGKRDKVGKNASQWGSGGEGGSVLSQWQWWWELGSLHGETTGGKRDHHLGWPPIVARLSLTDSSFSFAGTDRADSTSLWGD